MKADVLACRSCHRYFPNQGTQVHTNIQDIVKLLDNHVKNSYGSFKKAFLEIDKVSLAEIEPTVYDDLIHDLISRFYLSASSLL